MGRPRITWLTDWLLDGQICACSIMIIVHSFDRDQIQQEALLQSSAELSRAMRSTLTIVREKEILNSVMRHQAFTSLCPACPAE